MTLELYVFPPSPRAFRAMVVANYIELDWTLRLLNMPAGEHRSPDYVAMNPNMKMPTVERWRNDLAALPAWRKTVAAAIAPFLN